VAAPDVNGNCGAISVLDERARAVSLVNMKTFPDGLRAMLGLALSLALGIGAEMAAAPVAGNDATSATQPAVNDDAPGIEMRVQVGKVTWVLLYQSMNADGTLVQVEGRNASTAPAESAALKFFRADRLKTNR
jgi:hypothetical protein